MYVLVLVVCVCGCIQTYVLSLQLVSCVCVCACISSHRQLMVEALDLDGKAVLPSHQLVLQLSHVGLVCWLGQVVHQDVDEEVEQHQAEGEESR